MMKLVRNLSRDKKGAAVVELAMVAPVLALMVVGVVDLSNAFGRKLKIEQGAQRAIEKVMNTTGADTVENTIKTEAAAQAEVPTSNVTVEFRLECNGSVSTLDACPTGQVSQKWIMVEVTDRYTPLFPIRFKGLNGDGTYHVKAKSGIRVQ